MHEDYYFIQYMGEKPKYHPEEAAQKKTRSGSRVESKTKIFVSEKGDMGDFIHSEKLREIVDNIFEKNIERLKRVFKINE